MNIYVDIDETICNTPENRDYKKSTPIKENIKKEFRMTKTGLYIAYCPKCGKKFMPDKFQLKDGPTCHRGHSYITEPPENPADEIDQYRDGSMEEMDNLLKNIEANA